MIFAKTYSDGESQIVAMKSWDDEDGDFVQFFVQPPGLGICNVKICWPDLPEEEAKKECEALFDSLTDEDLSLRLKSLTDEYGRLFAQC